MDIAKTNSQYTAPETKDKYITPDCKAYEIYSGGIMGKTSYHYNGALDD